MTNSGKILVPSMKFIIIWSSNPNQTPICFDSHFGSRRCCI